MKFSTANLLRIFSRNFFRKRALFFPEISGKIRQTISRNFRTHLPLHLNEFSRNIAKPFQVQTIITIFLQLLYLFDRYTCTVAKPLSQANRPVYRSRFDVWMGYFGWTQFSTANCLTLLLKNWNWDPQNSTRNYDHVAEESMLQAAREWWYETLVASSLSKPSFPINV